MRETGKAPHATPAIACALLLCAGVLLVAPRPAGAQRTLSAETHLDKVRGMWLGQLIGNYAGRPYEGDITRGGLTATIDWSSFMSTDPWVGDDDTVLEVMDVSLLKTTTAPTPAEIKAAWEANFPANTTSLYVANLQARYLMAPPPTGADLAPPETGSIHRNHAWFAIDSQITTEGLGAVAPGMRQRAADLTKTFANVTNDGFPVHAAQFYSTMYAAAAMDGELPGATAGEKAEALVARGREVVPRTSRTGEVLRDVWDWYQADKAAGNLSDPNAWRGTQEHLYLDYGTYGTTQNRYRYWIESTVNVGLTAMALLYGQGDFTDTVEIGVLGGYDADCNPATAGGLIGMLLGYEGEDGVSGILADLPSTPSDSYNTYMLKGIGALTTVTQLAQDFQAAAELQILAAGGAIDGEGDERIYTLPADDSVLAPPEKPDPAGPKGLVGDLLAAGGVVDVSASYELHYPPNETKNLDTIIDGICDVSYNGHRNYVTDDGANAQPAGGDWYSLEFDRPVALDKVVFYEGEITCSVNSNPRPGTSVAGGYFLDLTVEVYVDGAWAPVTNLLFSEPLDATLYFQTIELSFDRIVGEAVRIRGTAGGSREFTSILELEAYGLILIAGDANADGLVDSQDFTILKSVYGGAGSWIDGDFTGDGLIDGQDFTLLKAHYGESSSPAVPEPGVWAALLVGGAVLLRPAPARRRQS